jgi:hypothetical protein
LSGFNVLLRSGKRRVAGELREAFSREARVHRADVAANQLVNAGFRVQVG